MTHSRGRQWFVLFYWYFILVLYKYTEAEIHCDLEQAKRRIHHASLAMAIFFGGISGGFGAGDDRVFLLKFFLVCTGI